MFFVIQAWEGVVFSYHTDGEYGHTMYRPWDMEFDYRTTYATAPKSQFGTVSDFVFLILFVYLAPREEDWDEHLDWGRGFRIEILFLLFVATARLICSFMIVFS